MDAGFLKNSPKKGFKSAFSALVRVLILRV